jgi:hypothetical protein
LRVAAELREEARNWRALLERVGQPLDLGFQGFSLAPWRGQPLVLHVRGASDWQPVPERQLAELEQRSEPCAAAVVELVIGTPDAPAARGNRRIVAPPCGDFDPWQFRFGIVQTPIDLVVDANGTLRVVTHRLTTAECALQTLCGR